jgi:hypothetical protein
MAPDSSTLRSRRAVLAGAVGATVAATAALLDGPATVLAGSDGDVVLGGDNTATTTTGIVNTTGGGSTLSLTSPGSGTALSLHAYSGVKAIDAEGQVTIDATAPALVVSSATGTKPVVTVSADFNPGVLVSGGEVTAGLLVYHGLTPSATLPTDVAIYGEATGPDPTAVWGQGGTATSINGSSTGVYGEGDTGVWGFGGWGVFGASDATGTGVYGFSGATVPAAPAHTGVFGYSDSGYGVYARAATGTALYVNGKANFSRSGKVAITAGHSSVSKSLAGVTTSSLIIAVVQTLKAGYYLVAAVPAAGKFTVYLNKAATATMYVAYFVVN